MYLILVFTRGTSASNAMQWGTEIIFIYTSIDTVHDDIFVHRKHCWGFHDINWHCLDSLDSLGPEQWGLMFCGFWWGYDRATFTKTCRFQSSFEATTRKYVADTCNAFQELSSELLYCAGPLYIVTTCFLCGLSLCLREFEFLGDSHSWKFKTLIRCRSSKEPSFVHRHKSSRPTSTGSTNITFDQHTILS